MSKDRPATIVSHPTPWQDVILVCRKCSKKLDGGFGPSGNLSLSRELKRSLRETGNRRTTRIVETKCLGICPKDAVTVLPATHPAAMLTVPTGTDGTLLLAKLLHRPQTPEPPLLRTAAPAAGS